LNFNQRYRIGRDGLLYGEAKKLLRYTALLQQMTERICRPFITLRNGKILFAADCGLKAFCFSVDAVRPKKKLAKPESNDESFLKQKT